MTIQEIKAEMKRQGLSMHALSAKLGVSYDNLRLILSGVRPLKEQLSRHIEYVLGVARTQVIVFTVDLPEATARVWAPGWEKLSTEEKEKAAAAVGQAAADALIARGESLLPPADLIQQTKQPGGVLPTVGGSAPAGMGSAPYPAPLDDMA